MVRRAARSRTQPAPRQRSGPSGWPAGQPAAGAPAGRYRAHRRGPSGRWSSARANAAFVGDAEQVEAARARARGGASAVARSGPWAITLPASGHSSCRRRCPRARPNRRVLPHRPARGSRRSCRSLGRKPWAGSSAYSRASTAWPRGTQLGLDEREPLARRDPKLLLDEIDPVDELGHRMLHLQARVHLQEVELAGVCGRDELDRAGALVARGPRQRHGRLPHPRRAAPASTTGEGASSITFW